MGQGNDGARAGLGNKHEKTRDVPRFRALVMRKNPYVLMFLFLLLDHRIGLQVVLLELFFGGAGLNCQAGLRRSTASQLVLTCPTVGAKCRGGMNDISINDGKKCGTRQRWRSRGIG